MMTAPGFLRRFAPTFSVTRMPYTLWSRGRLLGESDLGFVRVYTNVRMGWFHPSAVGEPLMPVITGAGPALVALNKVMRDPVRTLVRGADKVEAGEYPRDVRLTTEYADLVSTVDELEALQLELRDPEGRKVDVEHMGVDDTEWKMSLVPKKLRKRLKRMERGEPWEPESPPFPRYQLQVHFAGIPRKLIDADEEDA